MTLHDPAAEPGHVDQETSVWGRKSVFDDENPLHSASPETWDRLIEAIRPAALLVVIESRLNSALRRLVTPEDIWQETLLHVWRDRSSCDWRGLRSFRAWVLTIAENRIRDFARATKRGGGGAPATFSVLQQAHANAEGSVAFAGPAGSTTPSRVAIYREQAAAMQSALATLPDELREVVRLRLFEQLSIKEIADRLQIGESSVRHRFRKGAERFQRQLLTEFATRSTRPVDM